MGIKYLQLSSIHRKKSLVITAGTIAVLQFIIHLSAVRNYGFHRDELLYLALADHIDWGFKEVPPFIAVLGKFSRSILGSSMFAIRLIPEICSMLIVFLTGLLTIRLGGKMVSVIFSCLAITLSPAFLAAGYLFMPVVFDQLWWLLSAFMLVSWYRTKQNSYLLALGIVLGIGMLTKYTMAFYAVSLFAGIATNNSSREVFRKSYFWYGLLVAFVLFLPNLIWQLQHGIPFFHHMRELRDTQLKNIYPGDFLVQQLVVNGTVILIWLPGLIALFAFHRLKPYRFLGWAYIVVMLILLALKGKIYYGFGAYPPLFAAGGLIYEYYFRRSEKYVKWLMLSAGLAPNLVFVPLVIPFFPLHKSVSCFAWISDNLDIRFPLKWEDQKYHQLNQNYADMLGWDEMAMKTAELYNSLSPEQKQYTIILADNFGQAGAIDYYGKQYKLPPVVSLSSSYALWAPQKIASQQIIYVSTHIPFKKFVDSVVKFDEIKKTYASEKGTGIYMVKGLSPQFRNWYSLQWGAKH